MRFKGQCTLALVAFLAASTVGGAVATAEGVTPEEMEKARITESDGRVTIEAAEDTGGDKVVDPEDKGETPKDDGEITNNPNKGPLKIEKVSRLNFGKIKPTGKEIKAFAAPVIFENVDKKTESIRGNFVQFADVRADKYGYTVQAKMNQQFTHNTRSEEVLKNTTINYSNANLKAEVGNDNIAPAIDLASFSLGQDTEAQTILTADQAQKQGKGRYVLSFGEDETKAKESVELSIPKATASNMASGDYTAKITWTIVAAE